MAVTHTNRRGKTYYLHQATTSKGNPRYHFAQQAEGALVDDIPAGYEIYEKPNGQVFLRRKPAQIIRPEEVAAVQDGMRQHGRVERFIIDIKKNVILIYTPDEDVDSLLEAFRSMTGELPAQAQELVGSFLTYSPMLQFVLVDRDTRLFQAQRFSFFDEGDDWIPIGSPGALPALVRKYVPHLEQNSYFELH